MKLLVTVLAALLSTATVFAQPAPAKSKASKEPDYVISPKSVIEEDSSEHNRIDKQFQINAIVFGIGPSLSTTAGLQFGYFLNRNQMIVIEGTAGKLDGLYTAIDEAVGYSMNIDTKSIGAHFKHYVGNSFYYRAGIDLRSVDYSYSFTSDATDSGRFKGTSVAGNFQIGNQWQWSHFTLGCDWLGVSVPFSSSFSDRELGSGSNSFDNDRMNDDADLLVKKTHLNLLRLYLGASF